MTIGIGENGQPQGPLMANVNTNTNPLQTVQLPVHKNISFLHGSEVHGFAQAPELTQEQVDRAAASLSAFCAGLPADEQMVVAQILHQAAAGAELD
jgi:hypothetical protein